MFILVWQYYAGGIFLTAVAISMIIRLCRKKSIVNWGKTLPYVKKDKTKKIIEIVSFVGYMTFFAFVIQGAIIPAIKDFPFVITGRYSEDIGTVIDIRGDTIYIELDDGREIDLDIGSREISEFEKGDRVQLEYYKNLKEGFVFPINSSEGSGIEN